MIRLIGTWWFGGRHEPRWPLILLLQQFDFVQYYFNRISSKTSCYKAWFQNIEVYFCNGWQYARQSPNYVVHFFFLEDCSLMFAWPIGGNGWVLSLAMILFGEKLRLSTNNIFNNNSKKQKSFWKIFLKIIIYMYCCFVYVV